MPVLLVILGPVVFAAGVLPWLLALGGIHDEAIDLAFRGLCHQRPERTLEILGESMSICSRCAGLYAGVALGVLVRLPARWLPRATSLCCVAVAAMVLDVVTQDLGLHPVWHPSRLLTGLAAGWVASAWMFASLACSTGNSTPRPSAHVLPP